MNQRTLLIFFVVLGLAVLPFLAWAASSGSAPVVIFEELEGTWDGDFVGYDESGIELYRIKVKQTYKTVDDNHQKVTIEDRMPDGAIVRGEGNNIAYRNASGGFDISCDVKKTNGDRVQHRGRLIKGPSGSKEFIWYSSSEDKTETFREEVIREGESTYYVINGMGRYGDRLILMAGRYKKVSE